MGRSIHDHDPIAVELALQRPAQRAAAFDLLDHRLGSVGRVVGIGRIGRAPDFVDQQFGVATVRVGVPIGRPPAMEEFAEAADMVLVRVRQDENIEMPRSAGEADVRSKVRDLVILGILGLSGPVANIG